MNPFECLNKACANLIKHKGLQIIVESMTREADSFSLLGGGKASFGNVPTMSYNVTIRLNHNFSIDLVFSEDDFDPSKPWGIEKDLKLDGLGEDDRQVARFMYFFWTLHSMHRRVKLIRNIWTKTDIAALHRRYTIRSEI